MIEVILGLGQVKELVQIDIVFPTLIASNAMYICTSS